MWRRITTCWSSSPVCLRRPFASTGRLIRHRRPTRVPIAEGTLKAPGRVKLWREPPSAAEKARLADDTSRQIGTRDAFYGDLVPFLAALCENHSVPISFATVFGQKCTDPEPRGRAKEDRVRSALDDLVARLQAEAPGYREDDIDILVASAQAYVNAFNKLVQTQERDRQRAERIEGVSAASK